MLAKLQLAKTAAKYSKDAEKEVHDWMEKLISQDIGTGAHTVEGNLRNGEWILQLLLKVYDGTPADSMPEAATDFRPSLKINQQNLPFKQMENIEVFLKGVQHYGVHKTSCFQTGDLYEGRNMAAVLSTLLQLGTECQRNKFSGGTCGCIPTVKHETDFSLEILRAGNTIINQQSGSNQFATQKGMRIGSVRHVSDIRADVFDKNSMCDLTTIGGDNKHASQKGMRIGALRHVSDIRADDLTKESMGQLTIQGGNGEGASQSGMVFGAVRHVADIRADDYVKESLGIISLQMGSNQHDSQAGMTGFGAVRHCADIAPKEPASKEASGILTLQGGQNLGDSQAGMTTFGAVRHVSDIRADRYDKDSAGILSQQMGSNEYASQKGMTGMGALRHVTDILPEDKQAQNTQGMLTLQGGTNTGASQSGMTSFGAVRHISDIKCEDLASEKMRLDGTPQQSRTTF